MNKICILLALAIISSCQYKNKEVSNPTPLNPVVESGDRLEIQDQSTILLRTKTVTGEMTTIDSDFIDIAKINSPKFNNSFGDVQATAVEVKDTKAYIVYNVSGSEVGGAIDIVDISIPSEPKIVKTYMTEQYEFSDVIVRNNLLYASGYQKDVGAILIIFSIANDELSVVKIHKISGVYATDLSLFGNTLSVISGETGGLTELDISNPSNPTEISFTELANGLSVSSNDYFSFYIKGDSDTSITSKSKNGFNNIFDNQVSNTVLYSKKIALLKSEAPTRIKLKNHLLYSLNAKSKKFEILDASQSGKTSLVSPLETLGSLSVTGTPNGFDMDQQIVFLALGEEGVQIADIKNVSSPSNSGTLLFKNDNGSSNNIWVKETINDQKYVFIAHGRQGVRIITKKKVAGLDNKVVVSARGDKDQGVNAKFQIKINGTLVHTQEVTEQVSQYTYTHTGSLSALDKVDVIFINDNKVKNPNQKRSLFVNYLWVAEKYCYQKPTTYKETTNDFGFFETGDTLSYNHGTCETTQHNTPTCSNNEHIEDNTCVPNERDCNLTNGVGSQTWHSECGWGLCYPKTCNSGFLLNNGQCLPKVCTKDESKVCSVSNGTGTQTCLASELGYTTCTPTACNAGFTLQGGVCAPQVCSPNSTTSCPVENGTGSKLCSADGLSYGTCNVVSCSAGFKKVGNTCVTDPNYCSPNGSTKACSCSNGSGVLTCSNNQWSTTCTPTSCNAGYTLQGGVCVPQVCSPNSTTSCSIANGAGSKTCDSNGMSYGSCTASSCNSGFYLLNGTCLPQTCVPTSSKACVTPTHFNGTQVCSANGAFWNACSPNGTCETGYSLLNGQCVIQVCSPNSTTTCYIENGTGTKTCSSNGLSYGSCLPTTCNAGYVLDAGVCKPKVCNPYESKACQGTNGSGVQSCDSKGLSLGSCQITTCSSGYDKKFTPSETEYSFCSNEYENCITNADNVTVKYGKKETYSSDKVLSQTFACSNSVFGDPLVGTVKECLVKGTFSCELRVCKSNEYDNGEKCVPQVCSPNSTASCVVNNFVGTKTCSSNGSQYGACVSTGSCQTGYTLQNEQCVPQVCSPNSTSSCSVNNGSGEKVCASNGLTWGYCNPVSCQTGYTPLFVTAQTELIQNGNFSQSSSLIGSSNQRILSSLLSSPYGTWDIYSSLPSWSLTQGSGIEIWSDGKGSGFIELDGNENYKTSQSLSLDNTQYLITSDYLPRTQNTDDNKVGIYLTTGNSVSSQNLLAFNKTTLTQSSWSNGFKVFTPISGNYSVIIAGEGLSTSYGGFIDNISIKKITGDGSCSPQLCSPNTVKSCSINNFVGSQTCNSSGTSWGSCVSTGTCQQGYSLQNGQCVPQVCSPSSTTSCSVSNGSGTKTCDSLGLNYGSCAVSSCNAGYKLSNNSCVVDPNYCTNGTTRSCACSNGGGVQTCSNNQWSTTCTPQTCNSGYVLKNGTCVAQICTPHSSTSCLITNGTGSKTCSSDGLTYGSCEAKSCYYGYVLDGGKCVKPICGGKKHHDKDEDKHKEHKKNYSHKDDHKHH